MAQTDKILLVDDNEIDIFLNKKLLKLSGIENEVFSFTSGMSALDYFKSDTADQIDIPKLMLVDIQMPQMNGFQLIDELCKIIPDDIKSIKIFFLSSTIHDIDEEKADENPFVQEILSKPLDANYLKGKLEGK